MRHYLGIDLGGSAIKAGVVDINDGRVVDVVSTRPTPQPATPAAVAVAVAELVTEHGAATGPLGFAFPAVVTGGVARTAANVDSGWIGCDGSEVIHRATGRRCGFLNDADAAGLAEMRYGAGRGIRGSVLLLTLGTGIGTALFINGELWPNTELGHLEIKGVEAEHHASARVRSAEHLDWAAWATRVNDVLREYHRLLWPDLYIVSGGVTEHWDAFGGLLSAGAPIVPAMLRQNAGLVGAAAYAASLDNNP